MDDKNSDLLSGVLSGRGLVWIFVVAAGAFLVHEVPWQNMRPGGSEPQAYPYVARQDVDARLWEDPIGAVVRARAGLRKEESMPAPARAAAPVTGAGAAAGDAGGSADAAPAPTAASVAASVAPSARPSASPSATASAPVSAVVAVAGSAARAPAGENANHGPASLRRQLAERTCAAGQAPLVVGVMIPGGTYVESIEVRRRARYAALAGFSRMRLAPEDSNHIGYLLTLNARLPEFVAYEWLDPDGGSGRPLLVLWLDENLFGEDTVSRLAALIGPLTRAPLSCAGSAARGAAAGPTGSAPRDPASTTATAPAVAGTASRVSLPGTIPTAPSAAVASMTPRLLVIGPLYTSTLQDMLRRSAHWTADGPSPIFYAYGATADDAAIMASVGAPAGMTVHDAFAQRGLQVFRTIGTDSALAGALRAELIQRGVDPAAVDGCREAGEHPGGREHVLLIYERDTLYGRSLADMLTTALSGAPCDTNGSGSAAAAPPRSAARARSTGPSTVSATALSVHRFSYLRGLDGAVAKGANDSGNDPKTTKSAPGDRSGADQQIEKPEGPSQLDYLRRMSLQLDALQRDLRRTGQGSIKAVGIVGTDVYDKLLILQAMRPQFQDIVFFTTDLDARYQHPLQQDWARNLVVASNFGLTLHPALQGDILPFRDGYQTSIFLSTQIALADAFGSEAGDVPASAGGDCGGSEPSRCIGQATIDRWLAKPRIFEIGRTTAFDFSTPLVAACGGSTVLSGCEGVQPPGSEPFRRLTPAVFRNAVLLLALCLLLFAMARGFGTRVRIWSQRRQVVPLIACGSGALAIGAIAFSGEALWNVVGTTLTQGGDGEPISLVQGLSIWPSEAIRAATAAISVAFLFWAWRMLDGNLREIAEKLRFQPQHEAMMRLARDEYRHWSRWRRVVRAFSFRLVEYSGGRAASGTGLSWTAQIFWKKYLYQGRFLSRCCRVLAAVLVCIVVAGAVLGYFGRPNTPFRGQISHHWDGWILGASVFAMLFVIFFVVDATVFCHQIVKALVDDVLGDRDAATGPPDRPADSRWSVTTLEFYRHKFNIDPAYLDAWILMDFIELRTAVVARLIYFPFIVISLMVLSRSPFFDNWTIPTGLFIVLGAAVLIVCGCAVLLRASAEDARRRVLSLLDDDLIRLKGSEGRTGAQIEAMIARVKALHDGAFAPYSQQPLFRALLLPLSTFGGTALLDYFSAASF